MARQQAYIEELVLLTVMRSQGQVRQWCIYEVEEKVGQMWWQEIQKLCLCSLLGVHCISVSTIGRRTRRLSTSNKHVALTLTYILSYGDLLRKKKHEALIIISKSKSLCKTNLKNLGNEGCMMSVCIYIYI